jgi:hypothetical protein
MASSKSYIAKELKTATYNYVARVIFALPNIIQPDPNTNIIYKIGGGVPVNPIFSSGLTINSGFTYSNGTEGVGYSLLTDGTGYAYWGSITAVTSITATNGLSGNATTGAVTIVNTAPDQTVTITGGTNIEITGSYPDFGINFTGTTGGGSTGLTPSDYVVQGKLNANQSISANTDVVIQFVDDFDPQNWWNASTYQLTPTIAGYYNIFVGVWLDNPGVTNNQGNVQVRKNGNSFIIVQNPLNNVTGQAFEASKIVYLNGTTDYVDFTIYQASTGSVNILQGTANGSGTWFSASLIVGGSGGTTDFSAVSINNITQFTSSSDKTINFSGINLTITSASTNTLVFSAGTGVGGGGTTVTGGTYSAGTLTLDNSTGGTVSVTGFPATTSFGVAVDGSGGVITTGQKGYVRIPYDFTITSWTLIGSPSGSITFDIWRTNGALPTVTNTIIGVGGTKPNLSSGTYATSSTLTNWIITGSTGDVIGWNVDSCTSTTTATLQLFVTRTQ